MLKALFETLSRKQAEKQTAQQEERSKAKLTFVRQVLTGKLSDPDVILIELERFGMTPVELQSFINSHEQRIRRAAVRIDALDIEVAKSELNERKARNEDLQLQQQQRYQIESACLEREAGQLSAKSLAITESDTAWAALRANNFAPTIMAISDAVTNLLARKAELIDLRNRKYIEQRHWKAAPAGDGKQAEKVARNLQPIEREIDEFNRELKLIDSRVPDLVSEYREQLQQMQDPSLVWL